MKRSKYIDHTLLKADAQEGEIIRLCDEAKQHDFASVCVYSYWARTCAEQLKGTGIKVCCVAGFPSGAMSTAAKAFEAADAIRSGADEIDMVMNIGELKAGHADDLSAEQGRNRACLHDLCRCRRGLRQDLDRLFHGWRERGGGAADERNA